MESFRKRGDQPQALGEVLSQLFAMRGYDRPQTSRHLQEIWRGVAGEAIAAQTRVQGIRNGVLQIAVANSAMLQELTSFHQWSLLEQLGRDHPHLQVRNLKFRLQSATTR